MGCSVPSNDLFEGNNILHPETRTIACAPTGTYARKCTCAIDRTCIVFSFFVLLLLYTSQKEKYMLKWAVLFFLFTLIAEVHIT